MLPIAYGFDRHGLERCRWNKASLLELAQGLLVDGSGSMESFHHLVDGSLLTAEENQRAITAGLASPARRVAR